LETNGSFEDAEKEASKIYKNAVGYAVIREEENTGKERKYSVVKGKFTKMSSLRLPYLWFKAEEGGK
jgi:hypothetical protein